MRNAKKVILQIAEEYEKLTGRKYGLFEEYRMEDAEVGIVILNSSAGTAKEVVDKLRDEGVKAGLVKIRVFRPFPADEIAKALSGLKALAVMDKADSFSAAGGPVFAEVRSALYGAKADTDVISYIYGLGGRDVTMDDIEEVYRNLIDIAKTGKISETYNYVGVRE
jgi:pyruvate ferredoxin oxidoreductase alpha subunit